MAKLVRPKNTLKDKVGEGGFNEEDIEKAQKTIDDNEVDFTPIATEYLKRIKKAVENYKNDKNAYQLRSNLLDELTQLRSQGSMFQYPSITTLSDVIVDLLDSFDKVDSTVIEITEAYEKSALVLVKQNIRTEKNQVCQALVKELKQVCEKYKSKVA